MSGGLTERRVPLYNIRGEAGRRRSGMQEGGRKRDRPSNVFSLFLFLTFYLLCILHLHPRLLFIFTGKALTHKILGA